MAPPSKPPPAPRSASSQDDDGPRWLSRAEPAPEPPPEIPTTPSLAPKAVSRQLGVGGLGTYLRIGLIALAAFGVVIAALLLFARAGGSADTNERLSALPKPSASPSASASEPTAAADGAAPMPTVIPAPVHGMPPIPAPMEVPSAAPSASEAPSAAPAPTGPALGPNEGSLSTAASSPGHRVFVDGKYAGDTPHAIKVKCGSHSVKVGSGGTPHTLEVPCGGEVEVPAH